MLLQTSSMDGTWRKAAEARAPTPSLLDAACLKLTSCQSQSHVSLHACCLRYAASAYMHYSHISTHHVRVYTLHPMQRKQYIHKYTYPLCTLGSLALGAGWLGMAMQLPGAGMANARVMADGRPSAEFVSCPAGINADPALPAG